LTNNGKVKFNKWLNLLKTPMAEMAATSRVTAATLEAQ
jgi:hypothetical protein